MMYSITPKGADTLEILRAFNDYANQSEELGLPDVQLSREYIESRTTLHPGSLEELVKQGFIEEED